MAIQIPKLDATDYISGSEEEFQKKLNSGGSKFVSEPGEYTFMIDSITPHGTPKGDENWFTVKFVLSTADGATFNQFILFPIRRVNDFAYGEKKTLMVFKKLDEFLNSLGIVLEYKTAMSTIATVLQNLDSLVGKKIKTYVGYDGPYVAYCPENGEGQKYCIRKRDEIVTDDEGNPVFFANRDAAKNYAQGVKLRIQDFPDIKKFYPAQESALIVDDKQDDDIPF